MMKSIYRLIIWITIFSIAMGFLETTVVVYLRKIYYPNGFSFPLEPIDSLIALVEYLREAATIIMLLGIAVVAVKKNSVRFAVFIYSFAIWDIFYYIFLKLILDWPESLLTWDVLFLIPIPWVGPVWAPCLIALTMMAFALIIFVADDKGYDATIYLREWLLLILGSLVVIISFVMDYYHHISDYFLWDDTGLFEESVKFIPDSFDWPILLVGELIIVLAIVLYTRKLRKPIEA